MSRTSLAFRWLFGLALALMAGILPGCSTAKDPWAGAKPGQKRVLASFPPLYSMAQKVAGEHAYVLCLLSTTGPHEYQAPSSDMLKLHRAELILTNGLGIDTFMHKLVKGSMTGAKVVALGDALPGKLLLHNEEAKEEHKGHEGHHHHGDHDPHVWLGPPQAIAMTGLIAEQLSALDPGHKKDYEKNAAALVAELEKLQEDGQALLKGKKNRCIVSMHESLGYFAKAFGLEVVDSLQVQPGVDPDSARLSKLAEKCKQKKVAVFAMEPQYSQNLAKRLQSELGFGGQKIQMVEIDPLETAPLAEGKSNPDPGFYLRKMRDNIETLAKALP
jgi:ABC-type Zn uptake system ZnuABC Zn-binding protein ZnuA